ncbi:Asp23/Gls24 family envelope stress response protein [Sulfobacillus sp. DSM 109850]|uniref:Asp23/Gls24 family envelope stress response protein n=2 Tax=Sulfobacillus harzensis TaxID=2729629 RepID=A0A7Y0Q0L1_9FIRM|nr:Asp23/Gls24 family envelope stress response protein [Sulfobacillus harzensis]NMP21153.1 Asp23/Gls24 family envelope stress response protein [Sulfobacillus harzensis]
MPTIHIANDVIAEIAALAATEVEGVKGLAGGVASGLNDMLGRRSQSRGVRVDVEDRQVDLAVSLTVKYGVRIPEVAQKVQEHVKAQVERTTGLVVRTVDIHIQGVAFKTDEQADKQGG